MKLKRPKPKIEGRAFSIRLSADEKIRVACALCYGVLDRVPAVWIYCDSEQGPKPVCRECAETSSSLMQLLHDHLQPLDGVAVGSRGGKRSEVAVVREIAVPLETCEVEPTECVIEEFTVEG